MHRVNVLALVGLILGCSSSPPPEPQPSPSSSGPPVYLEPSEQLNRASMALRGLRPSPEDFEELAGNEDSLAAIVERYLDTDEFGQTIRDMHAETLLMRSETVTLPARGPLEGEYVGDIHRSLAEAPLMLIEDIVLSETPYTAIVTAQYMMADSRTSKIWEGISYDENGPEWQSTSWPSTRPRAGILSSSELWTRHISNGANYHRQRANMLADTLLCETFLDRDIPLDGGIDLSDPEVVADAVMQEKACVGCHQALDPLASTMWGFRAKLPAFQILQVYNNGSCDGGPPKTGYFSNCYPLETYNEELAGFWEQAGTRPPGYYGLPADNLEEIGEAIAQDSRFSLCAARRFYSYLTQTPVNEVPFSTVAALQKEFVSNDYNAKQLAKSVILSDAFLATAQGEMTTDIAGKQIVRPEQFARLLENLTGFVWEINADSPNCFANGNCWGDVDLSTSDAFGFRSMAGGIDGYFVTKPTHTATPVRSLYLASVAKEAGAFVVEDDFAEATPAERRLLRLVESDDEEEDAIRAQLQLLHLLILGDDVALDSPDVDESYTLWNSLLQITSDLVPGGDIPRAWSLVVAALLRDVGSIYY